MKSATSIVFFACVLLMACNQVDFKKTSGGVPYKIFSSGSGDSVKPDGVVRFQMIQKTKDSTLQNTYTGAGPFTTPVQNVVPPITYSDIRANVMEVLLKMKKGDSVYMVQSTDSILKQIPATASFFKKGDQVITTIRITDVYKNRRDYETESYKQNLPKMKEQIAQADKNDREALEHFQVDTSVKKQMATDNKIIENYLAAHNIQATKTPWGVYIQITDPGQGPKPATGQYVKVVYSGTDLKGQEFDHGTFPLQLGTPGVIRGFEEGIRALGKGGKARIFIPSPLGYGPQGSAPKIAPNEVLMFDIQLADISDLPIEADPQPGMQ